MSSRRGHARERSPRRLLEADGWWTCGSKGSFGDADVVALKAGEPSRLIECKSTAAGPFHSFGPADRAALLEAARIAGAEAWLAYWPPRRRLQWLHSSEWPEVRKAA